MKNKNSKICIFPFLPGDEYTRASKNCEFKKIQANRTTKNKKGKSIGHEMLSRSYIVLEFKKINSTKMCGTTKRSKKDKREIKC